MKDQGGQYAWMKSETVVVAVGGKANDPVDNTDLLHAYVHTWPAVLYFDDPMTAKTLGGDDFPE